MKTENSLCTTMAKNSNISVNKKNVVNPEKLTLQKTKIIQENCEKISRWNTFSTYLCYLVLFIVGYVQDYFKPRAAIEKNRERYTQLYASFESFYTRQIFRRLKDLHVQYHAGVAGSEIIVHENQSVDGGFTFTRSGKIRTCVNFGSYNYLGFAENNGPCANKAIESIKQFGIVTCSSRREFGNLKIHDELDSLVARFLGVEGAITFAMGFATNSQNIPALMDESCLVLSDCKNHCSIIIGLRLSGATIRVFKHNDIKSLEKCIRDGIVQGRPSSGRPWNKIFIMIEGIYSMEGSIANLPDIIALKKKYGLYIYLDEAHSIGAIGQRGRGICDYWGCDPKDVDILMGTFTKSFGSAGGYIAGSSQLISMLRHNSHAHFYGGAMSAPIAAQAITSMKIVMGEDGTNDGITRLGRLRQNSKYFRHKLKQAGFLVYGNDDSPVMPTAVYMPSKCAYTFRELMKRGFAAVVVGYPATGLVEARTRFCISSAHTKEMLDQALAAMCEIGDNIFTRN